MQRWYALKSDGNLHDLGPHASFEDADLADDTPIGVDTIWLFDAETAREWTQVLRSAFDD